MQPQYPAGPTPAVADATTRRLLALAGSAFVVLAAEPLYLLVTPQLSA
jgi:hypothetical protein